MNKNISDVYYTPSIEDVRIGYECLWFGAEENGQKIVVKDVQDLQFVISEIPSKTIDTLYLTKEQIEAEGFWHYYNDFSFGIFYKPKEKDEKYRVDYDYKQHTLTISVISSNEIIHYFDLFIGECKSINEFRTLLKWLEI